MLSCGMNALARLDEPSGGLCPRRLREILKLVKRPFRSLRAAGIDADQDHPFFHMLCLKHFCLSRLACRQELCLSLSGFIIRICLQIFRDLLLRARPVRLALTADDLIKLHLTDQLIRRLFVF